MKYLVISFVFLCSLKISVSNNNISIPNIKTDNKDSLAFELCQIYGLDQGIRESKGFKNKMKLIQSVDSFNFYRMVEFIECNGFPNEELLGIENYQNECVQGALAVILLHNPHFLINDTTYMQFFLDYVNSEELKEETFLSILDKYYWVNNGGEVLYGSKFGMPCISIKEKTNSARRKLGIQPLADSLFQICK
jgi:hypothetical protein